MVRSMSSFRFISAVTAVCTASFTAVFALLLPVAAFAQTVAPGAQAPGWVQAVPLVAMVAIFYFLILRPQQKREKTRQGFVSSLKRGDEVVTSTGMFGRVEGLTDQFVTLEISDGVRVKMLRSSVMSSVAQLTQSAQASESKSEVKGGKA